MRSSRAVSAMARLWPKPEAKRAAPSRCSRRSATTQVSRAVSIPVKAMLTAERTEVGPSLTLRGVVGVDLVIAFSHFDRGDKSRGEGCKPCFGLLNMILGYPEIKWKNSMTDNARTDGRADPVLVRLPKDLLQALDALRRAETDPPTRPEMIRRILHAWIAMHPPKA